MSATFFAPLTDHHDFALENLPPCDRELYEWLLRQAPAGKPIEIHLEDFQKHKQGRFNGRGYSLGWIKQALQRLIQIDLVEVVFKYSGKIFKLAIWHPGRQSAAAFKQTRQSNDETQQTFEKSEKIQPSNPITTDCSYIEEKEKRETTNKPTHHPVSTNEQERIKISPPILKADRTPTPNTQPSQPNPESEPPTTIPPKPPEMEISPEISEKIKSAGFRLNSTLKAIVASTTAQIVIDAIEAAQQYLTNLQQRNKPLKRQPEAVLAKAIQEQWQPQRGETGSNAMPPDFDEWFKLAQATKFVSMSSAQADLTGHPPGVLCVYSVSGEWLTYDEMRRLHPLAEIKETAKKQQEMVFTPSPRLLETRAATISDTRPTLLSL